jgi:hypothetical protein
MGLIGHWRRSVLGAGGVALLLPLGLALGVALTTALGGQTTLRALGQVFAGPSASPGRPGHGPGLEQPRSVPAVPVRPRRAPASAAIPASSPVTPAPGSTSTPGTPSTPSTPGSSDNPAGQVPAKPSVAPADTNGEPAASPLHDTAQDTVDAVPELPAPVGSAADDAMQTVVDLIP